MIIDTSTIQSEWEYVSGSNNGRGYHVANWILRGPETYQDARAVAKARITVPVEDYYVHTQQRSDGGWDVRRTFDSGD